MKRLLLLMGLSAWIAPAALAQSFCASDGQPTPVALIERFISADCEACWRTPPSPAPSTHALGLDWIVPTERGDEAPLSAAASRDALPRLAALRRTAPQTFLVSTTRVAPKRPSHTLRVAHGLPLGGYIGASIELAMSHQPRHPQELSAWLVLVETIPAGTDGTPTARNLVRNVLLPLWNRDTLRSKDKQFMFHETRPLSIPPGARPERLRVVGWVQDGRGRVLAAAQSVCLPTDVGQNEQSL